MPPINTISDAADLCARLAEYYQRRLNKALGVGFHRHVVGTVEHVRDARRKHKTTIEHAVQIAVCKAKRDVASEIARRLRHGHKRPARRQKRG